jgi:pyruvate dehydrogenase E2 component (dihydrolipoamide acetyltransferase)
VSDVVMPRLSDSMEEGTILRWLKSDGDEVRRGEELVEIETDKATMTYESDTEGVLQVVAAVGETLPVGAVIARLNGAGGPPPAAAEPPAEAAAPPPPPEAPAPPPPPRPAPAAVPEAPAAAPSGDGARRKVSPVARRIARELGVDVTSLRGTGPGGRIVRADVEAAAPAKPAAAPAPATPAAAPGAAKGEVTVVEATRAQGVIARRMAESRATIPDFTVTVEVDATAALDLRAQLKQVLDPPPSINDLVVKACALALREFPRVNASYRDGRFEQYSRVNVGVAVAGEASLIVPTVFDADRKTVGEIAREARSLAEKVRAGTVTPPELAGGTFTVSNLGMFGVREFTAVINPPQAAILSVGAAVARPVARDGEVVVRSVMEMTMACDHRIIYGADAARFLGRVRELLEQPLSLLV